MRALAGVAGLAVLAVILTDAFQTVVVARQARSVLAPTRLVLRSGWRVFAGAGQRLCQAERRETLLGIYGPLSLLILLGVWAGGLILGFALLRWAAEGTYSAPAVRFADEIYASAAAFFTLGAGAPHGWSARALTIVEAGAGLSFLGLVIGYLPVLYQSYSARELRILLLDARAGSPPSAAEFLRRAGAEPDRLEARLRDWEEWALDLLQSHLAYPMLAYYRSHHANQSWLGALTTIVDTSAILMLGAQGPLQRQAAFTFAAGRHALAHTAAIFQTRAGPCADRLPESEFVRLRAALAEIAAPLAPEAVTTEALAQLRAMYEPHAAALARLFLLALPAWMPDVAAVGNWQRTTWSQ